MYCPQCKSEYREGFDTCADCQIPLVDGEAPEIEEDEEAEEGLQILLQTTHPTALEPIVLKLEEQGIPYVVQSGTALSLLQGVMTERLPEDWNAVVLVLGEHLKAAQLILDQAQSAAVEPEEAE